MGNMPTVRAHRKPRTQTTFGAMSSNRKRSHPEIDLPPGWRAARSAENRTYFYHVETRESRWTLPPAATGDQIHAAASKCAYVWLLMNSYTYAAGAVVSAWSLRKLETSAHLVCMVTEDVPAWVRAMLGAVFDRIVEVPRIEQVCIALNTPRKQQLYGTWYNHAFTKWNALGLLEYDKVLFLDADTVVVRPIDDVFLLPAPAGTFSSPWHAPWNRDARRPNPFAEFTHGDAVPEHLVRSALEDHGSVLIGNCVLLPTGKQYSAAFRPWLEHAFPRAFGFSTCSSMFDEQAIAAFMLHARRQWTYLDQAYNAIPWKLDTGWLRGREPRLLHYFGEIKPWNVDVHGRGYHEDMETWAEAAQDLLRAEPQMAVFVTVPHPPPAATQPLAQQPLARPSTSGGFVIDEVVDDLQAHDDVDSGVDSSAVSGVVSEVASGVESSVDSGVGLGVGLGVDSGVGSGVVSDVASGIVSGLDSSAVSGAYDAAAAFKRGERRNETRDDSSLIGLRRANNFVKVGLNVAAVSLLKKRAKGRRVALRIFDVACGTGGDVGKFVKSAKDAGLEIDAYLGADISTQSVDECKRRLAGAGFGTAVAIDLSRRDVGEVLPGLPGVRINSFNIASCQFALHYFFRSEAALRQLARSIGRLLDDGGIFVAVLADAAVAIHDGLRDDPLAQEVVVGPVRMRPHPETRLGGAFAKSAKFGLAYDFFLGQHVQGATEYLTDVDVLARVMREEGHLHLILDVGAADMVRAMVQQRSFWAKTAAEMGMDTDGRWDQVMSLYRAVAFVRDTGDGELTDEVYRSRMFMHSILGIDDTDRYSCHS